MKTTMLGQGYVEDDFTIKEPNTLQSWADVLTTIVTLTTPAGYPTEEEVDRRLEALQNV